VKRQWRTPVEIVGDCLNEAMICIETNCSRTPARLLSANRRRFFVTLEEKVNWVVAISSAKIPQKTQYRF